MLSPPPPREPGHFNPYPEIHPEVDLSCAAAGAGAPATVALAAMAAMAVAVTALAVSSWPTPRVDTSCM